MAESDLNSDQSVSDMDQSTSVQDQFMLNLSTARENNVILEAANIEDTSENAIDENTNDLDLNPSQVVSDMVQSTSDQDQCMSDVSYERKNDVLLEAVSITGKSKIADVKNTSDLNLDQTVSGMVQSISDSDQFMSDLSSTKQHNVPDNVLLEAANVTENIENADDKNADDLNHSVNGTAKEAVCTKLHQCDICGKKYVARSTLTKHMKSAHSEFVQKGDPQFVCNDCGKTFRRSYDLKRHLKIHIGHKPFQCDQCDLAFIERDSLNKHIARKHCTVKKFHCTYCGKSFARNDDFGRHTRTHEGYPQRKFKCEHCGKLFQTKNHLEKHTTIHTGIKPYQCGLCHKKFARNNDLKRHATTVHSTEAICTICGEYFTTTMLLAEHSDSHPKLLRANTVLARMARSDSDGGNNGAGNSVNGNSIDGNTECPDEIIQGSSIDNGKISSCNIPHASSIHSNEIDSKVVYKCTFCANTFTTYKLTVAHVEKCHSMESTNVVPSDASLNRDELPTSNDSDPSSELLDSCVRGSHAQNNMKDVDESSVNFSCENLIHNCSFCSRSFSNKGALTRHVEGAHTGGGYLCTECGDCFSESADLLKHAQSHLEFIEPSSSLD